MLREVVRQKNALAPSSMVELSRCGLEAERRSDLKEEASDVRRSEVAARHKREGERDRHKIELLISGVGATNFGRPYKLGIYTPKLGLKPFRLITDMSHPLMDRQYEHDH
jgi:hypothetical protein